METRHTPHPWRVSGTSIISMVEETCIAVLEDDGEYAAPREARVANADLLAAAPDLLAATITAYRFLLWQEGMVRLAAQGELVALREAIAAATGRYGQDVQDEFESEAAVERHA